LLLAAAACATPPRAQPRLPGPYGEALAAATREAAVYEGLDPRLYLYATCETAAFRAARTRELARMFQVPESEADARAASLTAPAAGPVFLVALHSEVPGAADLRSPDAPWTVRLRGAQGSLAPESMEPLEPLDATVRALYPYVDRFFAVYRVAFAPSAGDGPLALVVAGPGGGATLSF